MRATRLFAAILGCAFTLGADPSLPPELQGVGVEEHLGSAVDLNLTFTAENGYPVALGDFFHKDRPVILNLVYYSCPMLCTRILNGQAAALKEIAWTAGNEFEVVTISIDPTETFNLAQQKRAVYLGTYGRQRTGWHFLTDNNGNAKRLAEQVGFHYRYDERQAQYAHPAVIMVLTPEGKVSRYLYGITFHPRDIRFALSEASESRFVLSTDRILLYCFHYDPHAHGYVLFASNLMRAGGVLTVLILALILFRLWRKEGIPAAEALRQ
jgi:protein SCO1/2